MSSRGGFDRQHARWPPRAISGDVLMAAVDHVAQSGVFVAVPAWARPRSLRPSRAVADATAEMVLVPRARIGSLLEPVMIMAYFFDRIASTVSATLRADSFVSAVA